MKSSFNEWSIEALKVKRAVEKKQPICLSSKNKLARPHICVEKSKLKVSLHPTIKISASYQIIHLRSIYTQMPRWLHYVQF